jgi:hypothetical protein
MCRYPILEACDAGDPDLSIYVVKLWRRPQCQSRRISRRTALLAQSCGTIDLFGDRCSYAPRTTLGRRWAKKGAVAVENLNHVRHCRDAKLCRATMNRESFVSNHCGRHQATTHIASSPQEAKREVATPVVVHRIDDGQPARIETRFGNQQCWPEIHELVCLQDI